MLDKGIKTLTDADGNIAPEHKPGWLALQWQKVDLLIQLDRTKEVRNLLETLGKTSINPLLLTYTEALLQFQENRWYKVAATLKDLAPELAHQPGMTEMAKRAFVVLGQCYEHMNNRPDQQYDAYRRALDITLGGTTAPANSLDVAAQLGVAQALVAQDQYDKAVDEYRRLLALPGTPKEVYRILAEMLIQRNLRLPDEKSRNWREVISALDDADRVLQKPASVSMLRANVHIVRNQLDEARQEIASAIERHPDLVDLWVALAAIAERQGPPEEALNQLAKAEQRLGQRVELMMARARYWGRRGGPQAVAALEQIETDASKLSKEEDRFRLFMTLADAYIWTGQSEKARQFTQRLADAQPSNQRFQLVLFEQCLNDKDTTRRAKRSSDFVSSTTRTRAPAMARSGATARSAS